MSAIVRRSRRIGANRLCARNVAIPAPSFRGRGQSAGRPNQYGSDRPCACMVPRPSRRPRGPPPFLRTAGRQGRLLGAGAPGGRSALVRSGSPRLQLRRSAPWPFLSFLPWLLASGLACPWGPLRLPSPRQPSALLSVGRPRGFGLLGGREFFRSRVFWWGCVLPRSLGFGSRPPQSPGEGFCRPFGRLRLLAQPLFLIQ